MTKDKLILASQSPRRLELLKQITDQFKVVSSSVEEKIDYGVELNDLTLYQTANYCQNDARLTYNLTGFNNDLLMNLLIVISRIARMPIDDISRMGVSQWIRSLLYYEHRQNGILIPRRQELDNRSSLPFP